MVSINIKKLEYCNDCDQHLTILVFYALFAIVFGLVVSSIRRVLYCNWLYFSMQDHVDISQFKDRLKSLYNRGMTGLATDHQKALANQLMSETGLSSKQISVRSSADFYTCKSDHLFYSTIEKLYHCCISQDVHQTASHKQMCIDFNNQGWPMPLIAMFFVSWS